MDVPGAPVTIRAYCKADYDEVAALWTRINRELRGGPAGHTERLLTTSRGRPDVDWITPELVESHRFGFISEGPDWVQPGNPQNEQMFSALPPIVLQNSKMS